MVLASSEKVGGEVVGAQMVRQACCPTLSGCGAIEGW